MLWRMVKMTERRPKRTAAISRGDQLSMVEDVTRRPVHSHVLSAGVV
jgi:hypothetical protein